MSNFENDLIQKRKTLKEAIAAWNMKRPAGEPKLSQRRIAMEIGVTASYWGNVITGIIKPTDCFLTKAWEILETYKIPKTVLYKEAS